MSKKVVHLADDAHELAKAYCKDSGMKMSDWVAMLIKRAVDPVSPPAAVQHTVALAPPIQHAAIREPLREAPQLVSNTITLSPRPTAVPSSDEMRSLGPKKKPMLRELSADGEDAVPAYAQPPFWARKSS